MTHSSRINAIRKIFIEMDSGIPREQNNRQLGLQLTQDCFFNYLNGQYDSAYIDNLLS